LNAARCRALLSLLKTLDISCLFVEHDAVLRIAEPRRGRGMLDGPLCKCLFRKGADGAFRLPALPADSRQGMRKVPRSRAGLF